MARDEGGWWLVEEDSKSEWRGQEVRGGIRKRREGSGSEGKVRKRGEAPESEGRHQKARGGIRK